MFGFKKLGVEWVIAVSAVGSLREEIGMGHVILVDQFIDKTKWRKDTFFGEGITAHVPFSEPVCHELRGMLQRAAEQVGGCTVHNKGTQVPPPPACRRARPDSAGAGTSTWRGQPFRPSPSRSCIAPSGQTSSG